MANKVMLTVVTPVKAFFEGRIDSVTLPTVDGEIGIMAGHSPLVFALVPGIAHIRVDDEIKHFVLSEGYAEISPNMALVVCDSAESVEDIDVTRMIESYKEAMTNIKNNTRSKSLVAAADARTAGYVEDSTKSLARAKARIHFVELYGSDAQKQRLERLKERIDSL